MRDKQIEGKVFTDVDILANDLNQHCADLAETYCGDMNCLTCLAHALTNKGYRKASDVAREIFEEIDNMLLKCISASHKQLDEAVRDNSHDGMIATTSASEVLKAMRLYIAELKKRNTKERARDEV